MHNKEISQYADTVKRFNSHEEFDSWLQELGDRVSVSTSKEIRNRNNIVRGCEVNTWIDGLESDGIWQFRYDSDSIMNRGLAKIITGSCSGLTSRDIQALSFSDYDGITGSLTLNKKKGMHSTLSFIHEKILLHKKPKFSLERSFMDFKIAF